MKKKILIVFATLWLAIVSIAQDQKINFKIENSQIKASIAKRYSLPFDLVFTKDFDAREIRFLKSKNDPGFLAKAKFGKTNQIQPFEETDTFIISLDNEKKLSFKMGSDNPKINFDTFFVKIGTEVLGPICIGDAKQKKQDKVIYDYKVGYLFYDALKLKELYSNYMDDTTGNDVETTDQIKRILSLYNITDAAKLDSNKFLNDFFPNLFSTKGGQLNAAFLPSLSSITSSIGGLDVTNIADGLAKFLVKRAKQELSMAFFDKLKKVIERAKDLQTLFPQTSYLLTAMGEEIYNYEAYVQNLREAFKDDIKNLPDNFPGIIDNHKGKGEFFDNKHQDLEAALRTACYVVNALQEQTHPGDILDNYPVQFLDTIPSKNYKGAVQTLQLISAALKDTANSDTASYWVNLKKVREMAGDRITLKIYLGLIYQKAKMNAIEFDKGFFLTALLKAVAINFNSDYDAYKRFIQGFATRLDGLNKMVKNYNKPATDSLALELYAKYFTATIDMIEYCTAVGDLPHFSDSKIGSLHKELKPYFNIAYASADLTIAINRKNYSAAINKAVFIYDEIIAKKSIDASPQKGNARAMDKKIKQMRQLSKETGIALVEIDTETIIDSMHSSPRRTLVNLVKYGSFMASVATAKTSDDVEIAIETFALPAGSSKIKRESAFNVSLNGYAGIYYGHEFIPGIKDKLAFNS